MQLRRTATPINASNLAFELTDVEYTIDVTLDTRARRVATAVAALRHP